MRPVLKSLHPAFGWFFGRLSAFFEWLFGDHPFVLLYAAGIVCWWNVLYATGHHLQEIVGDFSIYVLVACTSLMFVAGSPSRLARLLLAPLMVAIEMVFFFSGHHFLLYKTGAFFSTGFLLILYGEKMAMRRGMLKVLRPDALDHLLDRAFHSPQGLSTRTVYIEAINPCLEKVDREDESIPPVPF